ncbi:MAG TPA: DNA polymerase III subunit delta [Methyloceanibacter sp.]|nr:DNA polymerase III subunit delta [Methyloceanibacter sp.]
MVAYKTGSFQRIIKSLEADCRAALVYGPDAGLVAERAAALVDIFAGKGKDAAEIVRLDDRDLADDPARIEIELRTIPMFAERKVVRVGAGARIDVPLLKALLEAPLAGALVIEAGALRPDSALRKLFESHKTAAALPSYSDERSASELIDEELGKADLKIDSETRSYLMTRLGADQALSRAEVAKLALFASGHGCVVSEDIDAIVGDSAEIAVETFVYEVSGGETKEALRQLVRLAAAGTEPSVALSALGRHFTQLHRVASAQAAGVNVEQALRSLRPRPHFKREKAFVADSRRLGAQRLLEALPLIQDAVKRARLNPDLERAVAERLVLALTRRGEARRASNINEP